MNMVNGTKECKLVRFPAPMSIKRTQTLAREAPIKTSMVL